MQLPVTFMYPMVFWLLLAVPLWLWLQRRKQPAIGHSRVAVQAKLPAMPLIAWLPTVLRTLFLTTAIAALAFPVLPETKKTRTLQTRDIVVAVDFSGSMSISISGGPPPGVASDPARPGTYQRIDAARDAVMQFVSHRAGDRLGLLIFDDDTYYCWPLSDDLKIITRKAKLLNKYSGGGTNFEGPSQSFPGMGPLQAGIDHHREFGLAKSKVIILVTDGEASISSQRMAELRQQMQSQGIRLYVLGVGESWTGSGFGSSWTADLRTLVTQMNGKVFPVGDAAAMQEAFEQINQLELSTVQLEDTTTYVDIYHYFLAAAVILAIAWLGCTIVTREAA